MPPALSVIGTLFREQALALWPFVLGGILFAAFIKTFKWDRRIRASLVRHERWSVVVAVAAGLVSPLCSCGILPVVISLSAAGVPLPPVLALLITSPLMSPDAFVITVGQLGWTYALWKLAVATAVGLGTGFAARWLTRRGVLSGTSFRVEKMYADGGNVRPGYRDIVNAGCFGHADDPLFPVPRGNPGADAAAGRGFAGRLARAATILRGGPVVDRDSRFVFFLERLRDTAFLVGKYVLAALLVQAVVTYYVPANAIEPYLGRGGTLSVLFAALIAVPLPLHQVAAPSVIKGLLAAGMSPGAGMAMLIGGPVTSLPAITALAGIYDRKAFALYVGIGVIATVAAGCLFQYVHG